MDLRQKNKINKKKRSSSSSSLNVLKNHEKTLLSVFTHSFVRECQRKGRSPSGNSLETFEILEGVQRFQSNLYRCEILFRKLLVSRKLERWGKWFFYREPSSSSGILGEIISTTESPTVFPGIKWKVPKDLKVFGQDGGDS